MVWVLIEYNKAPNRKFLEKLGEKKKLILSDSFLYPTSLCTSVIGDELMHIKAKLESLKVVITF